MLFAPLAGIAMPLISGIGTGEAVMAALVAAVASFLTADLVIYPRYGNVPAAVADALISAAVLWEISFLAESPLSWPGLGLLAVLIAVGEWYYHPYLGRVLFAGRRK
ncbi:MAG: YndM family protein [Peptococcaceae bacterium]|nr:YndM family protein [Peptococcaceae bacterium]